jgi:glycerol-3-phosphate dehydrogenase
MENRQYDIVIIGAGIVGAMTARALSRFRLKIAVLEKEADLGMGQSTANSAILHSGHDPYPGTLKARMNKRGNELWRPLARELQVGIEETGALIVASAQDDPEGLRSLYERALENGIPGVEILSGEQALRREPLLSPECRGALWTPTAAVVDAFEGVVAAAENAAMNGVEFRFNTEVRGFAVEDGRLVAARTDGGEFRARWFINAAGVHADDVMHLAGDRPEFRITPRKGDYVIIDSARLRFSSVVFPMPTKAGKGILVAATVHGNTLVGPSAYEIEDKDDTAVTRGGLQEITAQASAVVPSVSAKDVIAQFAGVRATGNYSPDGAHRDFLIEISRRTKGLLNVAGIESPGYVSAPAIAEEVVRLLVRRPARRSRRILPSIQSGRPGCAFRSSATRSGLT